MVKIMGPSITTDEVGENPSGSLVTTGQSTDLLGINPVAGELSETSAMREWGVNATFPPIPEYVPDLITRQVAIRTYEKMRRNDAQIRATLKIMKTPILAASWHVEPASESKIDHEIAEFVEYNLFDGMSISWSRVLEEALFMFDYGFSVFEKVYKLDTWSPKGKGRRNRPMTMLKKLAPRPATTIQRFVYDENGGPDGIMHIRSATSINDFATPLPVMQFPAIPIAIQKLLIFTFDQQGGNLEGLSVLRSAYKHWYYKDNLYTVDAIQKERHGMGVPKGELPPGYTDDDKKLGAELLGNMRTNEKAFILQPPGWNIYFDNVPGNLVDALRSAEHHDMMIARNVLAQFINSSGGSSASGGGRAASAVMLDLFLKSLVHVANYIEDIFNLFCIPQLVDFNYDTSNYPKLRSHRVGDKKDVQMAAAALANLVDAGLLTPNDDTEQSVREDFDLPPYHSNSPVHEPPGQLQKVGDPKVDGGVASTNGKQGGSRETTGNVSVGSSVR
jgi:Protein of unknown function (DUF935).